MAMIEKINVYVMEVNHRCHNCHEKMIKMFTDDRDDPTMLIMFCKGCGDVGINTKDERQRKNFAFLFKIFKRLQIEGTAFGNIEVKKFKVIGD